MTAASGKAGACRPARTLVMGAAVGYSAEQIAPFLASLRRAGYPGDVVLLVDPVLAREGTKLPLFSDVTLLPVTQWLPVRLGWFRRRRRWLLTALWRPAHALGWLGLKAVEGLPLRNGVRRRAQSAMVSRLAPPTETRYLHFLHYLATHPYDRVLLSDVRDVVFQADPFLYLPKQGLAVSMEAGGLTVRSEHYNAQWVRTAYGADMLNAIGDRPVSCSGVTYGDGTAIHDYLQLMCDEILNLNLRAAHLSGVDQGIHNVLLWTGRLGTVQRLETFQGAVATLGAVSPAELQVDSEQRLLNRDGSLISLLHQYDRLPRPHGERLRATAMGYAPLEAGA